MEEIETLEKSVLKNPFNLGFHFLICKMEINSTCPTYITGCFQV